MAVALAGAATLAPRAQAEEVSPPFNRGAAKAALSVINYQACKKVNGPEGAGMALVTFAPDGSVSAVVITEAPFKGTGVGECVAGKIHAAHIPKFAGSPVKVEESFTIY